MAERRRVLITGAAGQIGSVLCEALAPHHDLSGIDLRPAAGVPTTVASMNDLDTVLPAFAGVDTVIDLANLPAGDTPWPQVYQNNIANIYNALEAAHRSGAKRLVFASSNRAAEGYELDEPYRSICAGRYGGLTSGGFPPVTTAMPPRPSGPYGIGKVLGEAAGRYFSDYHGLSVICLRLGTVTRANRPSTVRHFATILTHRDLAQLFAKAVAAPDSLRYGVFYGVSNNPWRFWDIAPARAELGYTPVDNMETFRAEWDATHPPA